MKMCRAVTSVVAQNFPELFGECFSFTFLSRFLPILFFVPINLLSKYPKLFSVAVIKF